MEGVALALLAVVLFVSGSVAGAIGFFCKTPWLTILGSLIVGAGCLIFVILFR